MNNRKLFYVGLVTCAIYVYAAETSQPIRKLIPDQQKRLLLYDSHGNYNGYKAFDAQLHDEHAGKSLMDYIGQKTSCIFALVAYESKSRINEIKTKLVEGRNWFERRPAMLANGKRVIGHARYYLVSEQEGDLVAALVGTDFEARSECATPRLELLRLFLQPNQTPIVQDQISQCYHRLDEKEKSIMMQRHAWLIDVQTKAIKEIALQGLSAFYLQQGSYAQVIQATEIFLKNVNNAASYRKNDPRATALALLCRAYTLSGDWHKVVSTNKAMASVIYSEDHLDVYHHVAWAEEQLGKPSVWRYLQAVILVKGADPFAYMNLLYVHTNPKARDTRGMKESEMRDYAQTFLSAPHEAHATCQTNFPERYAVARCEAERLVNMPQPTNDVYDY